MTALGCCAKGHGGGGGVADANVADAVVVIIDGIGSAIAIVSVGAKTYSHVYTRRSMDRRTATKNTAAAAGAFLAEVFVARAPV